MDRRSLSDRSIGINTLKEKSRDLFHLRHPDDPELVLILSALKSQHLFSPQATIIQIVRAASSLQNDNVATNTHALASLSGFGFDTTNSQRRLDPTMGSAGKPTNPYRLCIREST
jgi:hypothetical protein